MGGVLLPTVVAVVAVLFSAYVGIYESRKFGGGGGRNLAGDRDMVLLRAMADGWMAWEDSTTPIPISVAAKLTKSVLSGSAEKLPSGLAEAVSADGYDTVSIQKAWNYIRSERMRKLEELCAGEVGRQMCSSIVNYADPQFKLTPLHLARYSRDDEAAAFLQNLGADPDALDIAGRKPLNLSFTHFVTNSRRFAAEAGRSCELPEVTYDEAGEWKKEVKRLVREGEPLIIRGVGRGPEKTLDELVEKFGDRQVRVGAVPYADYFGMDIKHLTLREFVEQSVKGDDNGKLPLYVFAKENSINAEYYDFLAGIVKEAFPVPDLFADPDALGVSALHFALGRNGSGAPMHIHSDALNYVVTGSKRWFILPPQDAIYSRKHISDWVRNDLENTPLKPLECVQNAGDAIYVPFDWAHAVINQGDFTFAYALELLSLRDSLSIYK